MHFRHDELLEVNPARGPRRLCTLHHVAGYCKPSSLDGDQPTPQSFRIDPDGISVNHLEWFDENDVATALLGLQQWKLRQENFTTRVNGRFAIWIVGRIEEVTGAVVVEDPIEDTARALCSDPSHSLIQEIPGHGDDDAERVFKARLLQAVRCVRPALPP